MTTLRLGHIDYSNCVPVHALVLEGAGEPWLRIRFGVPAELNAALAAGEIDVAPASSIEYARYAERYRLLPGHVIAARGPVGSILLEHTVPLSALHERAVALPTASASSVVLLRLLLERRLGVRPRYRWFDQGTGVDPLAEGAAAALWIGDVALRRGSRSGVERLDLGAAWYEWTGLPFAFALWQVSAGPEKDEALARLQELLERSRLRFADAAPSLAQRHAERFGMPPDKLLGYWRSLHYDLDEQVLTGLREFLRMAAELGEAPALRSDLRWVASPSR
jgi:chorismate dehydratase